MRFGVITDIQHANEDVWNDRHFRNSLRKLDEIVKHFNSFDLDFVVNLGDTIDREFENFSAAMGRLSHFKAPLYNIPGNHDYEIDPKYFSEVPHVLNLPDQTTNYYHFDNDEFRLCFLDGNEISTFANAEGSENYQAAIAKIKRLEADEAINANDWNGGIGATQLAWLEEKLTEAHTLNLKVLLFCHYPIFPENKHNLLNSDEMLALIEKHPHIKAWFCGHNHDGNYGKSGSCHFVNFKGIVETEFENAYSVVEITENEIMIHGFGREEGRRLGV